LLSLLASITSVVAPGNAASIAAAAPPSQRLYVVTDSVGLGAEPWFPGAFPGWDVLLDGDAGEFTETMARKYVAPRAAAGQLGDYAIVATGYNYPFWDPARFDRSIDEMISTLEAGGVRHVLWVTLREVKPQFVTPAAWRQVQPYYWYFPTVNDHLEAALSRHPNLSLIDWAAVADQPGLTYDAIHLNPTGAALYTSIARQAVIDVTTAAPAGSVTVVDVPAIGGTGVAAVNLTTTSPRSGGFLTAYACGAEPPPISNHNYARAQVVAHSAIVPVSSSGQLCVFTPTATNFVVDLTGQFDLGRVDWGTGSRLVDTRLSGNRQPAGTPLVVDVGAGTSAVALNVTAVDGAGPGWAKAAPCDSPSTTSTVNFVDTDPVPNVAIVAPGDDGKLCVTPSVDTHLIVDRLATFLVDDELDAAVPRRVLDTRDGGGQRVAAGGTVRLDAGALGTDSTTKGVMLNLTATDATGAGFATAYPCGTEVPTTSSLNYGPDSVAANFVIVEPGAGGDVCIFSLAGTHLVVDVLGTTGDTFTGIAPTRLFDTRTANLPPGWP
jgi:hypothetical protein